MYTITDGTRNLQAMLESRRDQLKRLIAETRKALYQAPDGRLRAGHNNGRTQYFWRRSKSDRLGDYISKKNADLISRLAQKDYDEKILECASQEYHFLEPLLRQMKSQHLDEIYSGMNDLRKAYVTPRAITDEMFVQNWLSEEYEHKSFSDTETAPEFITDLGEHVRSKSELILANRFHSFGIPYQYEYPLYLEGFGRIHPDFRILLVNSHRVVYLEHNGMMSDPAYLDSFMRRQAAYIKNGYIPGRDVIFTFESADHPLDSATINRLCEELTSM